MPDIKDPRTSTRDDLQHSNDFPHPVLHRNVGGVETLVTLALAENPVATIHFLKGFKSSPYLYETLLREMNEAGLNVILVTLPDPEERNGFLDDYEKISKGLYLDGELDNLSGPDLPMIAANHSTGGYLLTKLLRCEHNAAKIENRYRCAFFAAPFYGNRLHRSPLLGPLKHIMALVAGMRPVGTTWLERKIRPIFDGAANDNKEEKEPDIRNNGKRITDDSDLKALANHRQAVYMDGATLQLLRDVRLNGFGPVARRFPTYFMLGKQDKVGFNKLSRQVAQALDAEVHEIKGSHSHVRKTPRGRDMLKNIALRAIAAPVDPRPPLSLSLSDYPEPA